MGGCKVGTIVWEVVLWEDGWVQGRHNSMGGGKHEVVKLISEYR
jgi:hypothetical protein